MDDDALDARGLDAATRADEQIDEDDSRWRLARIARERPVTSGDSLSLFGDLDP